MKCSSCSLNIFVFRTSSSGDGYDYVKGISKTNNNINHDKVINPLDSGDDSKRVGDNLPQSRSSSTGEETTASIVKPMWMKTRTEEESDHAPASNNKLLQRNSESSGVFATTASSPTDRHSAYPSYYEVKPMIRQKLKITSSFVEYKTLNKETRKKLEEDARAREKKRFDKVKTESIFATAKPQRKRRRSHNDQKETTRRRLQKDAKGALK